MACFFVVSRLHCVQSGVVLDQEAQVAQWVPIIQTLIMQVLLVVLLSKCHLISTPKYYMYNYMVYLF